MQREQRAQPRTCADTSVASLCATNARVTAVEAERSLQKANVVAKVAEVGLQEHDLAILHGMNARLSEASTNGQDASRTDAIQDTEFAASQEASKAANPAAAAGLREDDVASDVTGCLRK